jgi:putative colanic acid biosynthesis acetyltransferase WcaF
MSDPAPAQKTTHVQASPYASPWSLRERIGFLLWSGVWNATCRWTPKPLNPWRLLVLRCFGTKIEGTPFVHPRARIQIPWKLHLAHRACLGDRANAYTLGEITIGEGATIAQEAYLCTGTHDFTSPILPLQSAPIFVDADAFVGVRAIVLPGIRIGAKAVVGAGAVVTKDVPANCIVAGNPARVIGTRPQPS